MILCLKGALEISIEHIAKEAIENSKGKLEFSGEPEATGIFVPINKKMVQTVLTSVEKNAVDRVLLFFTRGSSWKIPSN